MKYRRQIGIAVALAVVAVVAIVYYFPRLTAGFSSQAAAPAVTGVPTPVMPSLASPSASSQASTGAQDVNLNGCPRGNYASPTTTSVADLKPLPIHQALYDAEAEAWGRVSLHALKAPLTFANVQTMRCWYRNEGTPHDLNNPLNLQTTIVDPKYGKTKASGADNDPLSDHIQAYWTPADFVQAFVIEIRNPDYHAMLSALMHGVGFLNSTNKEIERELKDYSGYGPGTGYYSIPGRN